LGNDKAKSNKNIMYSTSQKPIRCTKCGRLIYAGESMHMTSDHDGFICDECYAKWYEENYGRGK